LNRAVHARHEGSQVGDGDAGILHHFHAIFTVADFDAPGIGAHFKWKAERGDLVVEVHLVGSGGHGVPRQFRKGAAFQNLHRAVLAAYLPGKVVPQKAFSRHGRVDLIALLLVGLRQSRLL